ncbi:lytic transglycosylase domain-containing protein [Pedococcus sp. 2YAF34]|uniref:lytic transglycosylase domain-containing protein n=1 Tax=Pedococcus sp. 2YAF34 TaxID=3233032 RepID=UPI003F94B318
MTRVTRLHWRRAAAALPAVALIGSGIALASTGGTPSTDVVADSSPLITVPKLPVTQPEAPSLPSLPELPAPAEASPTPVLEAAGLPAASSAGSPNGIPAAALAAYRRGAQLVDTADAECNIDWALVAAIGKVESDHGRYGGNGIDASTGAVRPGIFGIPLNGTNDTAAIRDTDRGVFDRDTTWDRAVGPMQFIPGTWRSVGVDANGDGQKDPQNITDAATATAVYLCSGPGDLGTETGARSAVLRYNQSDAYADQVLAIARAYRGGFTVVPDFALTDGQRTGAPFLPSNVARPAGAQAAASSKPSSKPAAAKPSAKPSASGGKGGPGGSGVGGSGGTSGGGSTPAPSTTASGGVVGTVTDVVGGVVGGLTGQTPTPKPSTTTPTPTTTTTPALPLTVPLLGNGTCPDGYEVVLQLGIPVLCTRS